MKRLFLVPVLGAAALAMSASVAHAQFGGWRDSSNAGYADDRQAYYEARRGAYDNGYREGLKRGEQDARSRNNRGYQDERTWQRADKGYDRSYGDIDRYRQQFRAGYTAGYQVAFNSNGAYTTSGNGRAVPRYPNQYPGGYVYTNQRPYPTQSPNGYGSPSSSGYGYTAPAYPNGVNDGVEKGREDARKGRSYDPSRHDWYRDGDHDYKGQYGSKDLYRSTYRDGFREGYDRGYREGTYGYPYGR